MKYLISLFTSKVFKDKYGSIYYYDPITKNAYKLSGRMQKFAGLLPIRFAVALFTFLVLDSLLLDVVGEQSHYIALAVSFVALFIFEVILYKQTIPQATGIIPNYQFPPQTEITKGRRLTLFIAYTLLLVALGGYLFNENNNIPTLIAITILAIFAVVRNIDLLKK